MEMMQRSHHTTACTPHHCNKQKSNLLSCRAQWAAQGVRAPAQVQARCTEGELPPPLCTAHLPRALGIVSLAKLRS